MAGTSGTNTCFTRSPQKPTSRMHRKLRTRQGIANSWRTTSSAAADRELNARHSMLVHGSMGAKSLFASICMIIVNLVRRNPLQFAMCVCVCHKSFVA